MKMKEENPILKEWGQTFIIVAVLLVVLLGIVGLGTDVGYLRFKKQQMRKAADAGAIAGASDIPYGNWDVAAKADSKKNGFEDGKDNVTVTVNKPPLSGPHVAGTPNADNYVEVIVARPQPTFFMKVLGKASAMVKARSVAVFGSSPTCMYALSSSGTSFQLTPGGGYAVEAKCGIIVNSNSSSALKTNGNSLTADFIGIRKPGTCDGCASYQNFDTLLPDPLAYLPTPTPHGTIHTNTYVMTTDGTLPPGEYKNGITIGKSSGTQPNVTLSGEYYITGGTLNILNGSTYHDNNDTICNHHVNLHGSNVFIYLGQNAQVSMGGGNGKFVNSCGGVSAATTGTYAGILFWQDRATSSYTANVSSGQGDGFTGTLYFPSVALRYNNSNPSSAQYLIMVAKTINMYRDMTTIQTINSDYSSLPGGSPIHTAVLAE